MQVTGDKRGVVYVSSPGRVGTETATFPNRGLVRERKRNWGEKEMNNHSNRAIKTGDAGCGGTDSPTQGGTTTGKDGRGGPTQEKGERESAASHE